MYKKIVVLALACVTAVMLVACGGGTASSSAASSSASSEAASSSAASSEATSSSAASSAAASSSAASSSSADAFKKGAVSGDAYTNDYFGVKFTLPNDWAFLSDAELAEVNGKAASTISNEQVVDMLESGQAFIDMFARQSDKLANVNLTYEKFDSSSISITPEDVLENAAGAAKQELEAQGFSGVELGKTTTEFCGESAPCITFTYEIQGTPVYQRMVAMVKGDYILTAAASTAKTDTCGELLGRFELV